MPDTTKALDDLVTALDKRTQGMTGRQFENAVSPRIAKAFVEAWIALGRNGDDIPDEWLDLADTFDAL
jgi:hypothetical protein